MVDEVRLRCFCKEACGQNLPDQFAPLVSKVPMYLLVASFFLMQSKFAEPFLNLVKPYSDVQGPPSPGCCPSFIF